jgi:acetolactate synthase-1/2/3 large subunit
MAKGCVDMDADYCLYTIGLGSKDVVSCAVDAADVVITLGYDMVEYPPRLWNPKADKQIIHIDFLPAEIDANYHPDVEVVGDLAHTLWMLNERLHGDKSRDYELDPQTAVRREIQEDLVRHKNDDTQGSIRPQKALWDARQAMGPEDILLSDVGAHKMWIARYFHAHQPNTVLIPNGFCSMGFAVPASIAASMVYPERRILAICGDAGFLMNVQEMETAKRLGVDIVVMVWEDGTHGLLVWKQDIQFGRHTDLSFGNPDWMALAEAFGWHGHRVERSRDLSGALETAFQARGPRLVVLPIDYRENALLTERLGDVECSI